MWADSRVCVFVCMCVSTRAYIFAAVSVSLPAQAECVDLHYDKDH